MKINLPIVKRISHLTKMVLQWFFLRLPTYRSFAAPPGESNDM
jgi:hypothetical protein